MIYEYVLMMSPILKLVPMIRPANPIIPIIEFRQIIHALTPPDVVCQRAQHSRNGGNKMPNVDSVKAPIKDMKISKFGITNAARTEQ